MSKKQNKIIFTCATVQSRSLTSKNWAIIIIIIIICMNQDFQSVSRKLCKVSEVKVLLCFVSLVCFVSYYLN